MKAEERSQRARRLFLDALELDEGARDDHLRAACGGDGELLAEVRSLLAYDTRADGFLDAAPAAADDDGGGGFPGYRIESTLGEGSMSIVYRAVREADGAPVAIKVLHPGYTAPGLAHRLAFEAEVLARLHHPGIARLLDTGTATSLFGERPFLVEELVEGRQLLEDVRARGLGRREVLELWLALCDAVEHAHRNGVIHRDLKPANVLVDGQGRPRILDFGVARLYDDASARTVMTRTGELVGTVAYMSPEQLEGRREDVDTRTDVYSLGVIGYELLCGARPHELGGLPLHQAARTVLERPPRRPRALAPGLDRDLETILLGAVEPDRGRRYASVSELAGDLRRCLAGEPIRARPPSAVELAGRFVARHRLATGLAALALAALVAFSLVVTRLYLREQASAEHAREQARDVLRLSAFRELEDLVARADRLWPPHPGLVPAMERWLTDAGALAGQLDALDGGPGLRAQREALARRVQGADGAPGDALAPPRARRWWLQQLERLIAELERFADPDRGLLSSGAAGAHGFGVPWRLERARELAALPLDAAAEPWADAIDAVAADPRYAGFALEPIPGLLPLGPDPESGLQEFWHVLSGDEPVRGLDGRLAVTGTSAVVLVLLPARADAPPFLFGKHELTQGQWTALDPANPSVYPPGFEQDPGVVVDARHPVDSVSYDRAERVLARFDLRIPTDVEWELADRGGTDTRWWSGSTEADLAGCANLADRSVYGRMPWRHEDVLDDGYLVHAPVGSFRANPFGLHDTMGNVVEWVAPQRHAAPEGMKLIKGGSFSDLGAMATNDFTHPFASHTAISNLGVRVARDAGSG